MCIIDNNKSEDIIGKWIEREFENLENEFEEKDLIMKNELLRRLSINWMKAICNEECISRKRK